MADEPDVEGQDEPVEDAAAVSEELNEVVESGDATMAELADALEDAKVYVAVDALSWRPHPLPRGTEVSGILPADVIEARLADGSLSRERPS